MLFNLGVSEVKFFKLSENETQVGRWGNSPSIRLPAVIGEALSLKERRHYRRACRCSHVSGQPKAKPGRATCAAPKLSRYDPRRFQIRSGGSEFPVTSVTRISRSMPSRTTLKRQTKPRAQWRAAATEVLMSSTRSRTPYAVGNYFIRTERARLLPQCANRSPCTHSQSAHDAMVAAAALDAGCQRLMSESIQDGLLIQGKLRVYNLSRPGLA